MPEGVTVSELCATIDAAINDVFADEVWVRGAISGLNRSANGHVYFDLVDPGDLGGAVQAVVPVALFANARYRVNAILRKTNALRMTDGVEIQIRGRVAYYPRQGRVQLIMSLIDPSFTLGQLEMAKAQLLADLARRDLIEANRRLPFPVVPLRVALITSAGSAAEADFVTELRHSGLDFDVTLYDSRVQGDQAVEGLAAAINEAAGGHHDVLAVIRGGGARTDLAAFDHRLVAEAIATSALPVVVGIGHEVDRSVADEVAAVSLKTPTACAAHLVDTVRTFAGAIDVYADRIITAATTHLEQASAALLAARHHLGRTATSTVLDHDRGIEHRRHRLVSAADRATERHTHRLREAELRVRSLDPALALARGWSITHDAEGRLIRSSAEAPPGTRLVTRVGDGTISSTVDTHSTGEAERDDQ